MEKGKEPAFKKNMLRNSTDYRTICEVLREIYWAIEDPDVRLKVMEAFKMAKKMNKKLTLNKFGIPESMEYEELSEEDQKEISEERWNKYKEEMERGIEHPMKAAKRDK